MPNFEFKQLRQLKEYIEEEEGRDDEWAGNVLRNDFHLDAEIELLRKEEWLVSEIINYIITANTVLWAQCWLRNPQNPSLPLHLFTHQKSILNCRNRYKITRCGRQVGKTLCMAIDMLHSAMTARYMELLYVAPYQAQVKVLMDKTLLPLIADVPEIQNSIAKTPSHPYYQVIFHDGCRINAMTAGTKSGQKGASIRGTPADKLYLDEMDFLGSEAISAVVATTFARPNSTIWASSTPIGKREQFYHWCMDRDSEFRCPICEAAGRKGSPFHYPSQTSPLFTKEVESFYRKRMPAAEYDHEVLGEWGEEMQGVFRHVDIDYCLDLGKTRFTVDEEGTEKWESYRYEDMVYSSKCMYVLGVDWNKDETGVQLCVIEYNPTQEEINSLPPYMYRVFRTEIVTAKEFTEEGSVARILAIDEELSLAHVYCDAGYGSIQIEALKKIAILNGRRDFAERVVAVEMGGTIPIYDPLTDAKIMKPTKPFMVDNASRVIQSRRVFLPDHEDEKVKLVGQMREYLVLRRGVSGQPIYSKDNEDMLTAFMLAMLGFAMEYSELTSDNRFDGVVVAKDSISARAADSVKSRTGGHPDKENVFEKYGIPRRGPKLEEIAAKFGLPYSYTTDKRPEDERAEDAVVQRYAESLRGRRTDFGSEERAGRSRPTRRTF